MSTHTSEKRICEIVYCGADKELTNDDHELEHSIVVLELEANLLKT